MFKGLIRAFRILRNQIQWFNVWFDKHKDEVFYFIKKRRFAKAYDLIWSQIRVRDLGGGRFDRIFRAFPKLAHYPKEIEIEITTRCHLKCIMCEHTYWPDKNDTKQDMSFDQFKTIINMLPRLKYVCFAGIGTYFMNRDFFKMLEYLNLKNIYASFVDNFNFLKEVDIEKLIKLNIERIEVSLDAACKETYEKIRAGAKWEKTINNLETLKKMKKEHNTPFPDIFFRFVAMKNNINEIPALMKLISELDVNPGKKTDVQVVGLLIFKEIEYLNVDRIPEQIINEAYMMAKQLKNINLIWTHTPDHCESINYCAKWLQPYVMVDGSVILDCALLMSNNRSELKRTSFGNLFKQDFKHIWSSPRYKKIRQSVNILDSPVPKLCEGCRGYDTTTREHLYGIQDDNVF